MNSLKTEQLSLTYSKEKKSVTEGDSQIRESLFGSSTSLRLCRSLIVNYNRGISKELASICITHFKIVIISMANIS